MDIIATTLPHSSFGDAECCGCLNGIPRGDEAEIACNECEAVVFRVPAKDLRKTITEMELSLDVAIAMCQHCGAVNLFPGFSKVVMFTCKECGEPNQVASFLSENH